jgi:hypothetical protein|tara:strand:+ start:244 stop:879 length:636 start_codon:yes stop_codon:yes gene_type:complete
MPTSTTIAASLSVSVSAIRRYKTMGTILAIDPGTVKSGWCVMEQDGTVNEFGWTDNDDLLERVISSRKINLVLEDISNYGMAVGRDTFETVKWLGRFDRKREHTYITRPTIKAALCNTVKATDANVRQAVIDRYGGDAVAIGGKKCINCKGKGWTGRDHDACEFCHCHGWKQGGCGTETHKGQLYGVSSHVWSAIALGLTYLDQEKEASNI